MDVIDLFEIGERKTNQLKMYDPALWNAFVRDFGGKNIKIVNIQDEIVDFSAEFYGTTVLYSNFCNDAEHEVCRIIEGIKEEAERKAELTRLQMLDKLQYKSRKLEGSGEE